MTTTATGLNITDDVSATAQTYNGSLVYGNVLATQGFVDLAIAGNIATVIPNMAFTTQTAVVPTFPTTSLATSPTYSTLFFEFYFTVTANIASFTQTFNKNYYQGTISKIQMSVGQLVNLTTGQEVGQIQQIFSSKTTITTSIFGGAKFTTGTRYYYNLGITLLTT